MDSDTEFLLRAASVAVPAFAGVVFGSRCSMLAHEAEWRRGRDDTAITFRDNWAVMRTAWRQPGGPVAVVGALVSSGLALVAFIAWMRG